MKYSGRDLVAGGLCISLSVAVPWLFHVLGLGSIFLPIFYPILAAGFLTPLPVASVVGFLGPLVSAVLTGMPPFYPPMAFVVSAEGIVLASIPAILRGRLGAGVRLSLAAALVGERLVLLAAITIVSHWLSLPAGFLSLASFLHSLPGITVIFILFPPILSSMEKRIRRHPVLE
jgi:hypothetical protein